MSEGASTNGDCGPRWELQAITCVRRYEKTKVHFALPSTSTYRAQLMSFTSVIL